MLRRKFRRPGHATVVAYLALFVALGGTGAYAANTIRSTDIVDGEVKSADVKDQSLTTFDVSTFIGADIVDGSLTAKDVGENAFFNFAASIPAVPAQQCRYVSITGVLGKGDHMVLTPDFQDDVQALTYGIEYEPAIEDAKIKVCNPTVADVSASLTHFNLLVFQH